MARVNLTKLQREALELVAVYREQRREKMTNKVYDVLKWGALVFVPALATFLGVLAPVWSWDPALTNAVLVSLTGFGVFLGTLLGISTIQYRRNQGE